MYNERVKCTGSWLSVQRAELYKTRAKCTSRRADEIMVKVKVLTGDVDMWTVVVLNSNEGDNRRHCSNLRIIV